ncbi:3-phosphoshikimate 1-carboxyvinyltransferase [compost metagenome]
MACELGKLGAEVEAGADYLKVTPRRLNAGVAVDTYDDHRMAMSLSLAALGGVALRINDPDCVAKTFPDYFEAFATIAR